MNVKGDDTTLSHCLLHSVYCHFIIIITTIIVITGNWVARLSIQTFYIHVKFSNVPVTEVFKYWNVSLHKFPPFMATTPYPILNILEMLSLDFGAAFALNQWWLER